MSAYTVVANGLDDQVWPDLRDGRVRHTVVNVWNYMLKTICLEYPGLDPLAARLLPMSDVVYWYDGLRPRLMERTRPRPKKQK